MNIFYFLNISLKNIREREKIVFILHRLVSIRIWGLGRDLPRPGAHNSSIARIRGNFTPLILHLYFLRSL